MTSSLAARWTVFDRAIQAYRFRKVVSLIPPNSIVVDVGCGDGSFLRSIAHRIKEGFGVDRKTPPSDDKITFLQVNADNAIALPPGSVDVVTALALLEHLEYPGAFVSEAFRILKDGGVLILTTPSPAAKPLLEFLAFRLGIISKNDIADHKKYYSHSELSSALSSYSTIRISSFQCGLNTLVIAIK
jgi:2-polyprenyl-3-methyl-5-hydroxy-6-metoxy-1,4-benzoquinol methylase